MRSAGSRIAKRQCVVAPENCTAMQVPWNKVCKAEQGLVAKMFPATHIVMALHVSKSVRAVLQAHAERVEVGNHITRSWLKQIVHGNKEGADVDEVNAQRFATGLSQFRSRGVQVEIGGRLFLTKVCRAVVSAYAVGWKGQIVSLDVSHFCSPFSAEASRMANQMFQACRGLTKVTFAFDRTLLRRPPPGLRRLAFDDITSAIANSPCLLSLSFRSDPHICRLSSIDAAQLMSSFAGCSHLQHINLTGFYFGIGEAATLAKAIELCPELISLNLGGCKIVEILSCLIAAAKCSHLEHLDLYGQRHTLDSIEQLATNIAVHWKNLKSLNLRGNRLEVTEKAFLLAQALRHAPSLEYLDIRDTRITQPGVLSLAVALRELRQLVHFDVSKNAIGKQEAAILCGALAGCKNLVHLNLSFNHLGPQGAEMLALVLPQLHALQYLNLFHTSLGDIGAGSLANVTGTCPKLRYIDLRQNGIGNFGAMLLGNLVHKCPCLKILDLSKDLRPSGKRFKDRPNKRPSQLQPQLEYRLEESGVELLAAAFPGCSCGVDYRGCTGKTSSGRECWRIAWSESGRRDVVQFRTCQGGWCVGASEWKKMRINIAHSPTM